MSEFIPAFDWTRVMGDPWTVNLPVTLWIGLMAPSLASATRLSSAPRVLRITCGGAVMSSQNS